MLMCYYSLIDLIFNLNFKLIKIDDEIVTNLHQFEEKVLKILRCIEKMYVKIS